MQPAPVSWTLLAITGIDLGNYSTRDLQVEVAPIALGELARDVNGNLVDMTLESFRKYAVTLTCTDVEAPDLVGVWRGKQVTLSLIPDMGLDEGTDGPMNLTMMVDSWQSGRRERLAESAWSITFLQT